ncbi:HNH endonuclease [Pseudomonas mosselii]|uniref:HNH endonuclease n=1 Tax=Pseudomonas mosselii TaxID=78327 RepID=UPI0021AC2EFE|nr:restriction endonuclease [Pseudomonas mosselii]
MEINFLDLMDADVRGLIPKRDVYTLVKMSKVHGSDWWHGEHLKIGNTPQQGINWVGQFPSLTGVIVKVWEGSYKDDGWIKDRECFRYSLKAVKGVISLTEKANRALIQQPAFSYPIALLTERGAFWRFEGVFRVSSVSSSYVELSRFELNGRKGRKVDVSGFEEGSRRYVEHLTVERNKEVVALLKSRGGCVCDICCVDFEARYKVSYIEAHHKVPISACEGNRVVTVDDFALLCANCHSAVHLHMRDTPCYEQVKSLIQSHIFD